MDEGTVVIVGSGQAGTVWWCAGVQVAVILRNNEVWSGAISQCRVPQTPEELDLAPLDVVSKPERRRTKRYVD